MATTTNPFRDAIGVIQSCGWTQHPGIEDTKTCIGLALEEVGTFENSKARLLIEDEIKIRVGDRYPPGIIYFNDFILHSQNEAIAFLEELAVKWEE